MNGYLCVDIGGTSVKHGILEETDSLRFLSCGEMETRAWEGGARIVNEVGALAHRYMMNYEIRGICVSTAGMVDCDKGIIMYSSPLIPDYTGMRVKEILEITTGLACEVENDVNCVGLAEYNAGAAKGYDICLCLTIGTGIGGAVVINGDIYRGAFGSAGEIGYMYLPGGRFQDMGAAGILTARIAKEKNIPCSHVKGEWIFRQAKEGDAVCIRAIDDMTEVLGMGIANACYVLNPDVVVLGGGIMAQADYLMGRIRHSMSKYLIPAIEAGTRLAAAENGNRAGMLGAYFHFQNMRRKRSIRTLKSAACIEE